MEFGRAGWIAKARQQPEKVKQVLQKFRTDGLAPTIEAVFAKLDQPQPLGYCNCGKVAEVGSGVEGFVPGDRVVSNGPHAEIVCVPVNLCAKVPDGVPDEEAAFAVLSAVALQGIRLMAPTLGETYVVIGLGLVGMLAAQLFRASGCNVIGVDIAPSRAGLARTCGVDPFVDASSEDPVAAAMRATAGQGVDGVLIAAATESSEPLRQAAKMCRKRGRIVLVGVAGLHLDRAEFYEKELSFQVSCSYGPGRYDEDYEKNGHDYPIGYVRWTEGRNFEAVLDMMASRRLDVRPLIGKTVPFGSAPAVYDQLGAADGGAGILFEYPTQDAAAVVGDRVVRHSSVSPSAVGKTTVGVIGAGNFASQVLLPILAASGVRLGWVVSESGVSAARARKRFGFAACATDYHEVLSDPDVDAVFVATRHDLHAGLAAESLRAGKHVFVEKPLALTMEQLNEVMSAYEEVCASRPRLLVVGFNRRFAPHVVLIKKLLGGTNEPKVFSMMVNAGMISARHWTNDPAVGGGRIIGEGCHFIDLLRFLAGSEITGVQAARIGGNPSNGLSEDKAVMTLSFADGSLGTIQYLANGHKSYPKERLEIFCGGRILVLDNFRRVASYGWRGFRGDRLWRQDKGHAAEVAAFLEVVEKGGASPISFAELVEVTRTTLEVSALVRQGLR